MELTLASPAFSPREPRGHSGEPELVEPAPVVDPGARDADLADNVGARCGIGPAALGTSAHNSNH
eukprot:1680868-Pyramimonas_sp.AAC.1